MITLDRAQLERAQHRLLIVGVVLVALCAAAAIWDAAALARSYLLAHQYWLGVSVGSIAWLLILQLTGGRWGRAAAPLWRAAAWTTPLVAVALIPVILGMNAIYPWADDQLYSHLAQAKQTWYGLTFFLSRAAVYIVVWIVLAWVISHGGERARTGMAGPGLALLIVTVTFASVDWIMSLDPRWHSTVYGLLLAVGHAVAALSLAIVVYILAGGGRDEPGRELLHDLGKLLLTGVTLWAYLSFSQFLIIWYGNLPEEIAWYMPRMSGAWGAIAIALVVLHFAAPFFILLSRANKRRAGVMLAVAAALLVIRFIDLSWLMAQSFAEHAGGRAWWAGVLDAALTLGVGALWLAWFVRMLRRADEAHERRETEVASP